MTKPEVTMNERELQEAVIELAQVLGWKVAHFRPAQNARGNWRTPVAADGKGFPDLVMVSSTTIAFIELKSAKGKLTTEQKDWIGDLMNVKSGPPNAYLITSDNRLAVGVWRPEDWISGTIEEYLRRNA